MLMFLAVYAFGQTIALLALTSRVERLEDKIRQHELDMFGAGRSRPVKAFP